MQHYVAREIIRQRTDEIRAQASRDEAGRQAREARHARAARHPRKEARQARDAGQGRGQATAPEAVPPQRVPDDAEVMLSGTGPVSHAC
jgi:hypothetical protein